MVDRREDAVLDSTGAGVQGESAPYGMLVFDVELIKFE